jgi:hypothetical protein
VECIIDEIDNMVQMNGTTSMKYSDMDEILQCGSKFINGWKSPWYIWIKFYLHGQNMCMVHFIHEINYNKVSSYAYEFVWPISFK